MAVERERRVINESPAPRIALHGFSQNPQDPALDKPNLYEVIANENSRAVEETKTLTKDQLILIARERILNPDLSNTLTKEFMQHLLLNQFSSLNLDLLETSDMSKEGSKVKLGDLLDAYYSVRRDYYRAVKRAKSLSTKKETEKAIKMATKKLNQWKENIPRNYPGVYDSKAKEYSGFIDDVFKNA